MKTTIAVGALLLSLTAAAASAATLTLDQAVTRALEQSEEVQLTRAQLFDARGRVREALSSALPQINGSVTYRHQIDSIFEGFAADTGLGKIFANSSFGAVRDWTLGIEASQLLFDGGRWLAGMRGAKLYLRAANEQNREAISDLVYRVKSAYYQAAAAEHLLAIAQGSLEQARKHEAQVALFHQQGTRAEYDLLRAQVDAANQEPAVVSARTAHELALLRLEQLINWRGGDSLELATPLESADGTVPVPASTGFDTGSRGALAASRANVGLQEQAVRVARAARWPTITASTSLQHQAFPQGGGELPRRDEFLRNWDAQIKLTLPIFTGFRTGAEIQRARAALNRAKAERDQAAEQVALEAADARARLDLAAAQLGARRETVRRATRAYELSEIRYTNGISTQLEVSDARLEMQTSQVNQIEAARDYLVALAGLERAIGRPVPVVRKPLESLTLSMNAEAKPR